MTKTRREHEHVIFHFGFCQWHIVFMLMLLMMLMLFSYYICFIHQTTPHPTHIRYSLSFDDYDDGSNDNEDDGYTLLYVAKLNEIMDINYG